MGDVILDHIKCIRYIETMYYDKSIELYGDSDAIGDKLIRASLDLIIRPNHAYTKLMKLTHANTEHALNEQAYNELDMHRIASGNLEQLSELAQQKLKTPRVEIELSNLVEKQLWYYMPVPSRYLEKISTPQLPKDNQILENTIKHVQETIQNMSLSEIIDRLREEGSTPLYRSVLPTIRYFTAKKSQEIIEQYIQYQFGMRSKQHVVDLF